MQYSKMILWSRLENILKALGLNEKQRFNIRKALREEIKNGKKRTLYYNR